MAAERAVFFSKFSISREIWEGWMVGERGERGDRGEEGGEEKEKLLEGEGRVKEELEGEEEEEDCLLAARERR